MRDRKYVTMMDPFQIKYGKRLCGLLSMAPLMSEIVWVTSTLISLGNDPDQFDSVLNSYCFICITAGVSARVFVFNRCNYECDPGSVLRRVHLDLGCCGHHLHPAGRPLLCGLHRHHSAHSHFHHLCKLIKDNKSFVDTNSYLRLNQCNQCYLCKHESFIWLVKTSKQGILIIIPLIHWMDTNSWHS